MSKIDEYRTIKSNNENAIEKYRLLLGYYSDSDTTDPTNTNCVINFSYYTEEMINLTLSYNNGVKVRNRTVVQYILNAINEDAERIIRRAKVLAQAAIDDAKSECLTEAQDIIDELSTTTTEETTESATEETTSEESATEESTDNPSEVTENDGE